VFVGLEAPYLSLGGKNFDHFRLSKSQRSCALQEMTTIVKNSVALKKEIVIQERKLPEAVKKLPWPVDQQIVELFQSISRHQTETEFNKISRAVTAYLAGISTLSELFVAVTTFTILTHITGESQHFEPKLQKNGTNPHRLPSPNEFSFLARYFGS
jgi:hypothetical protein